MTIENLIEALVRETGQLIADLMRLRYPMASIERLPEILRTTIVTELTSSGEPDAVVADVMGVTVRTVRQWRKADASGRTRTLAQRTLDWLDVNGAAARPQLEAAVCRQGSENSEAFTTLLHHLARHGLIQSAITRNGPIYVRTDLLNQERWDDTAELACQIQALLVDLGTTTPQGGTSIEAILDGLGLDPSDGGSRAAVLTAIGHLESAMHVHREAQNDGEPRFTARTRVRPADAEHGLATSLFEHLKAVMRNVSGRVSEEARAVSPRPTHHRGVTFELAVPHGLSSHHQAAVDVIEAASARLSELRARLDGEAQDILSAGDVSGTLLTVYLGQTARDVDNLPRPPGAEADS